MTGWQPRILVPPGIGDIHWIALKLRAMARATWGAGTVPRLAIWDFDGRPRGKEYVERLDGLATFGGYWSQRPVPPWNALLDETYLDDGEPLRIGGMFPLDGWWCMNGKLLTASRIEDILPQWECDWDYRVRRDAADAEWFGRWRGEVGLEAGEPFLLASFSSYGMFSEWARRVGVSGVGRLLRATGMRVVLTGGAWDVPFLESVGARGAIHAEGKTTVPQLFELMRRAKGFVGWCGGNTMLATHLGCPTWMVWSEKKFDRRFWTNWVRPGLEGNGYWPLGLAEVVGKEETLGATIAERIGG